MNVMQWHILQINNKDKKSLKGVQSRVECKVKTRIWDLGFLDYFLNFLYNESLALITIYEEMKCRLEMKNVYFIPKVS